MLELVRILSKAQRIAASKKIDGWQLAIDIEELYRQGITVSDIRQSLLNNYCELKVETTDYKSTERLFEPVNSLAVPPNSCLVVTANGLKFLETHATDDGKSNLCTPTPFWDFDQRSLYLDDTLIKRFRCPARNQETVLSVFQEMGWPERIDDPLPMVRELDRKQRLQDTIKGLNRNRKSEALKFLGDGTGCGINWQVANSRFGAD